ncbi:2,3-bisphosphoglycerate-independent phosphoglycerate mutase [uncultured Ilumatobacter sp.]|jgi:2,3-bisphosphoglycerate-independent phosphoglycerate mutase|uniref:2,3-bisphosphoglycerate-independent phosphoglycerate mutase n=1 Tax=Ilumatobacter sp. TaxID=1967498 RepID=UPI00309EFFC0|tara:strand:- start:4071 stop:5732 length:1662 start_codon:yes stop_codon:yes gene_type:complete
MALSLSQHPSFSGRPGPVLVIVADGVGVAPAGPSNAVTEASTPTLDLLTASELYTELAAHGPAVGLPTDDDMGNSEVGHNALGAGRIFAQGAKLVNKALASGAIFETDVWKQAVECGAANTLHLLGLHSNGGVHSTTEHLYQLLRRAADEGVTSCAVHILHDGRDVAQRSALTYIQQTEAVLSEINAAGASDGHERNFRIASGGGRMTITMDRYEADWDMVERGYLCHTHGEGPVFASATDAVETMYAETDKGDQYLGRFVVGDAAKQPVGAMHDGDAVLLFNYRGDRSIEISRAYEEADFDVFDRAGANGEQHPDVFYAGMLQYDGDALIPKRYLVDPPAIDRTMGEFLCAEGVRSFAISETQKFGHVTYFWNGNKSGYINESLETYVEIPSDNVEFDTTPAMKVREITAETIDLLRSGEYQFGRLNFPSGDMVGHTGHLHATVEAMEVIDECMAQLVEVIDELGGVIIYTADHGNADVMYTVDSSGDKHPKTSHTLSPVPFAIHDPNYDGEYHMVDAAPGDAHGLANVAATVFNLLGFVAPDDYLQPLITF